MTQITTIDTNNYATMAQVMGFANEKSTTSGSMLPRLRIHHTPIMGTAEVNGKNVNVEVVEGGMYKLEVPDGDTYYASSVKMRVFMQRFMYKRYVNGDAKTPGRFIKSLMTENAKMESDLKDDDGGFNCGKPAGYIQDFKALPEKTQDLIKQIKRVRVLLGTVEMVNPVNDKGEPVKLDTTSFVWEIDNRDAYKELGNSIASFAKMQRLPVNHFISANTEERKIPTGASYYIPVTSIDMSVSIDIDEENDHALFSEFVGWVERCNTYVANKWKENVNSKMESDETEVLDDILDIDVDNDDEAA